MATTYHTLIVWDEIVGKFCIEFGDYTKLVVQSEYQDARDHGFPTNDLHIITTDSDDSEVIAKAVADFNASKGL